MSTHKHAYQRLSDEAVFCRECGDIKRAEPPVCTLPHYQWPYFYAPVYPTVQPWRPPTYPYWIVSSGTAETVVAVSSTYETTTVPTVNNVTFTAES